MLKRIYIDNFRCLVNFELELDSINLFLGENGSGKSTVFEVLWRLKLFINRTFRSRIVFPLADCTRWQTSKVQRFELDIEGNGGNYKYELAIQHDLKGDEPSSIVEYERLWFDGYPLLKFERGQVELYNDNYEKKSTYAFDWAQSVLPFVVSSSSEAKKLIWFRECFERFIIVQINPSLMLGVSNRLDKLLTNKSENFVSWYQYQSQDQGKVVKLSNILKEVLDKFEFFRFEKVGEQESILKLTFSDNSDGRHPIEYRFKEISDGQQALVALYALICCTQSEGYTLCIDEPENFLALPEIQTWLDQLYDLCSEKKIQALLISHHPKSINFLASSSGYWFERKSNAPVRVKTIADEHDTGLPISELVARGWLYDPE